MKKAQKQAIAIGSGVAALAAAAAGAYFFAGKHGAKNRKKVANWADKAKRDVMGEMNNMQKVTKQTYHKTVDNVLKNYKALKNVDAAEVAAMATELKGHWDAISAEMNKARKNVVRVVPKVGRSVARKVGVKRAPAKKAAPKKAAPKKAASKKRR